MKKSYKGALIFAVIIIAAFNIGSYILTATFFGLVSLVGFIALVETIRPLKWIIIKLNKAFDIMLMLFTIIATMYYGLNIAASLTVAGLGYTLVYAPHLRENSNNFKASKPIGNYREKFNNK